MNYLESPAHQTLCSWTKGMQRAPKTKDGTLLIKCTIGGGCLCGAAPPVTMKTLCLNCRGCGQPEAVQELRLLVEQHSPEFVFLSETTMSEERAKNLRFKLGFDNAIAVSSEGLSGELVLMWKKGIIVRNKPKIILT